MMLNYRILSLLSFLLIAASCGKGIHRQERTIQKQGEPSEKDIKLAELRTHIENLETTLGETKAKLVDEKYKNLETRISEKAKEIEAQSSDPETIKTTEHITKLNKYIAEITLLVEKAQTIATDMKHCLATINFYVGGKPLASYQEACLDKEGNLMSATDMQALKEDNEARVISRKKAIETASKKITELTESLDAKIKPLQTELQALENDKSEYDALSHQATTLEADIARLSEAGMTCNLSAECDVAFVTELLRGSAT